MFPQDAVFHLERKDDELKQNVMRVLRTKKKQNETQNNQFRCPCSPGCSASSRKEGWWIKAKRGDDEKWRREMKESWEIERGRKKWWREEWGRKIDVILYDNARWRKVDHCRSHHILFGYRSRKNDGILCAFSFSGAERRLLQRMSRGILKSILYHGKLTSPGLTNV